MITKASADRLRPHLGACYDPDVGPHAFVPREGTAEILCRAFGAETVLLVAFYPRHTGYATWARDPDVCPRTQELAREVAAGLAQGELTHPGGVADVHALSKRQNLERRVIDASLALLGALDVPDDSARIEGPVEGPRTSEWLAAVRALAEHAGRPR